MNRTALRRLIVAGFAAGVLVASAAPALAVSARPRPPQPISPPGVEELKQDENAARPTTGSSNKANSPNF